MKYFPHGLSLLLTLSMPSMACAQPITQVANRSDQATIVYLYRMNAADAPPSQNLKDIQALRNTIQQQHPHRQILFFRDLTDKDHYISLITSQMMNLPQEAGWSKGFVDQYTKSFSGARAFVLESTLLVGDSQLDVAPSSLIEIEHVDSDPTKRKNNLPLFQSLESSLRQIPGFKDLQVWTWNNRINHWTVIEVWDNLQARESAKRNPELIRLWDAIYGNAAAPNSQGDYQLLQ